MAYQVTIERMPGFIETRETFTIRAETDGEARKCAECETRIAGSFAQIVEVTRV